MTMETWGNEYICELLDKNDNVVESRSITVQHPEAVKFIVRQLMAREDVVRANIYRKYSDYMLVDTMEDENVK